MQVECDDGTGGEFNLVYTGPETGLEAEGLEVSFWRHTSLSNVALDLNYLNSC